MKQQRVLNNAVAGLEKNTSITGIQISGGDDALNSQQTDNAHGRNHTIYSRRESCLDVR